ncbi:MAG TPA: hypothetical protein VHS28_02985, partial [Chloroflexota bacterium]|nr:hypothetical protein [Chloroflexota bacterium]
MSLRVGRFSQGHDSFRPALPGRRPPSSIPTRGGNTIVLDVEALRTYPNMAPVLNGISLRRGDTLWCTQLAYLGVEMMLGREKR